VEAFELGLASDTLDEAELPITEDESLLEDDVFMFIETLLGAEVFTLLTLVEVSLEDAEGPTELEETTLEWRRPLDDEAIFELLKDPEVVIEDCADLEADFEGLTDIALDDDSGLVDPPLLALDSLSECAEDEMELDVACPLVTALDWMDCDEDTCGPLDVASPPDVLDAGAGCEPDAEELSGLPDELEEPLIGSNAELEACDIFDADEVTEDRSDIG
jgi:hypothetical protein